MRSFPFISTACLILLLACNDARRPSNAIFTVAINQYLAKHGEACTLLGGEFPIDIPKADQNDQSGTAPKLAALEEAGLVHGTETTAVVHSMLDPLRGPTPPQPVKKFDLTEEGKKYVRVAPSLSGKTSSFCYGQKSVDSIVKWTRPPKADATTQVEVVYTYKLVNLASWAQLPDVQKMFPDIRSTVNGTSKTNQIVGLQLSNEGWEVPGL